jgi:hypothetical protein
MRGSGGLHLRRLPEEDAGEVAGSRWERIGRAQKNGLTFSSRVWVCLSLRSQVFRDVFRFVVIFSINFDQRFAVNLSWLL